MSVLNKPRYKAGDCVRVYPIEEDKYEYEKGIVKNYTEDGCYVVEILDLDSGLTVVSEDRLKRDYTHISPSALAAFELSKDEFYMKYMARYKAPAMPQTQPMSIGSSFDAYVKSYIIKVLSRGGPIPPEYDFENLFAAQVEEHNREWAREHGLHAFEAYKKSGALADIMLEISGGEDKPRFEFDMKGLVEYNGLTVPLAGKPDLHFIHKLGARVTKDWKVNGYCSKSGTSPKAGYTMCRDGWDADKHSRNHRQAHKDAWCSMIKGINVNCSAKLETIDRDWATQLCTYGWLMGEPIGSDFICGVEQLSCSPSGSDKPNIRVASFNNLVSVEFQNIVFNRYQKCWRAINSGHYFEEMSLYDSKQRCIQLEGVAKSLRPTGDVKEDWFSTNTRAR